MKSSENQEKNSGMNKSVAIIGSVGIPAKYGGFETLAEYLTKNLSDKVDFTVYCSAKAYPKKLKEYNHSKLEYIPLKANGIQSIPYDIISLLKVKRKTKTVLILGVACGIILPLYRLFYSKKLIVNIDGLEWKREKWGKVAKWYLKFSEKVAVKSADVVIADNKVIQDYVQNEYGKNAVLIEYGADHSISLPLSDEIKKEFSFTNFEYAFKVCRIEPENNIKMILEAFSKQTKYHLVIVGNWENSEYGIDLFSKFSKFENIHLCDPIYDLLILNQLRSNAFLYIHGHSAGGTNPSLVEAMYLSIPIISFDINYNRETTENKAYSYFKNSTELVETLKNIDKTNLITSKNALFIVAERRYQWENITDKYLKKF